MKQRNLDTERWKAIQQTQDWALICEEIDFIILSLLNRLKGCRPDELADIQRQINIWEQAKHLPQQVVEREEGATDLR